MRTSRLGRRPYLCVRSRSVCLLRVVCRFKEKCVFGGPYFKKVGNGYVLQPVPANSVRPRQAQ